MATGYQEIENLKIYYLHVIRHSLRRVIFSSKLANTLTDANSSPRDIFVSALTESTFVQKQIFTALNNFLCSPHAKAWKFLYKNNLLEVSAQENFNVVANHAHPENLARALVYLNKVGLLQGFFAQKIVQP